MINLIIAVLWEQYVQHDQNEKLNQLDFIEEDEGNEFFDDEFESNQESTYKITNNVKLG